MSCQLFLVCQLFYLSTFWSVNWVVNFFFFFLFEQRAPCGLQQDRTKKLRHAHATNVDKKLARKSNDILLTVLSNSSRMRFVVCWIRCKQECRPGAVGPESRAIRPATFLRHRNFCLCPSPPSSGYLSGIRGRLYLPRHLQEPLRRRERPRWSYLKVRRTDEKSIYSTGGV